MQEVKIMESRISIKDGKNVVVFKVEGDFDNLLCIKYKNVLTEILARKRCDLVVFDLSLVSFIDSSGIGLLLGRYKQVKEYQGDIVICGVNKQIKKTLAISGIALIIDTYEEIFENLRGLIKVYE
jgi:stage II sporulation protein AA (anti-sigma F factor antagonist)